MAYKIIVEKDNLFECPACGYRWSCGYDLSFDEDERVPCCPDCGELIEDGEDGAEYMALKEKNPVYNIGDKVFCMADRKNYIVAGTDFSNKTVLGIDCEKEMLSCFQVHSLKQEDLLPGWINHSMDFKYKRDEAPSFKELFAYIENIGKKNDLSAISVFNTDVRYVTSVPFLEFNSWKSLSEHPLYQSNKKIENFYYEEDSLIIRCKRY